MNTLAKLITIAVIALTSTHPAHAETVIGYKTFHDQVTFNSSVKTNNIVERTSGSGVTLDGVLLKDGAVTGNMTGNADTATALASNPTDCASNQYANAIAASGNLTCAAISDADVPDTITVDLAATATALAADPADCPGGQFAISISAGGALTCTAISDIHVPDTLTLTNAVLTQGDAPGTCATGDIILDTGGSAIELCFCQATNTWLCSTMAAGPTD